MEKLIVIIVIVFSVVIIKELLKAKSSNKIIEFPYIKNKGLFTPAERSFLGVLTLAVSDEYKIFGKVRVADVVKVKSMSDRKMWQRAFNRISSKHFDFVLCNNNDLSIFAVIELNDKSHQAKKRQKRDSFIEGVCNASKLPLIQVPAKTGYKVSDIKERIQSVINLKTDVSNLKTDDSHVK